MNPLLMMALLSIGVAGAEDLVTYSPPSGIFSCKMPAEWTASEESEPSGTGVHLLGKDSKSGTYRTGIDIHWVEFGRPGVLHYKEVIKRIRRKDSRVDRRAGGIRRVSTKTGMARVIEVRERRRLPLGLSPSLEENLHHYVAVIPNPGGYFVIRLSSVEEEYLDYKKFFFEFLRTFSTGGSK